MLVSKDAQIYVAGHRGLVGTSVVRHLQERGFTNILTATRDELDLRDQRAVNAWFAAHDTVLRYSPEEAEKVTGIPAEDIRWTARRYATTEKAGIYYTLGITEHSHGTDNVYCLANLVLMTGHLGKPSAGMNPLRGQNNVQGANDAGATPIYLPGYQRVDDPEVHAKYEKSWGVKLSPEPGMNLNIMMKQVGKRIKGMFVMGEDIVLSEPNVKHLEEGLNNIEFLVYQDIFLNETARFADVILPAAVFAEKEGTFTNSERRVQLVRKAVEPPGMARPDWEIIRNLANAAGASWNYETAAEVYDELARDTHQFAGISHARIDAEEHRGKTGIQWPCPNPQHPGTEFLHEGGALRGKALFVAADYRPSMEVEDEDYGLLLSTGRTLYHYNCATQTRRETGLDMKQSDPFVEIHRRDARKRGIEHGDLVEVSTRRGAVQLRAMVSRQVRPGCIWMPLHFAEARANLLTNDAGDPVTQTAEYKVCAAEITKLASATESERAELFPGTYYGIQGPGYHVTEFKGGAAAVAVPVLHSPDRGQG